MVQVRLWMSHMNCFKAFHFCLQGWGLCNVSGSSGDRCFDIDGRAVLRERVTYLVLEAGNAMEPSRALGRVATSEAEDAGWRRSRVLKPSHSCGAVCWIHMPSKARATVPAPPL